LYLKKIEIFGFKSFATKTHLVFEPGVTAIVGPNGCGKSNISDSIKWVLGEQSAKELRGSKMEDIIFNGTNDAEPVNIAEVSLTLSNSEKVLSVDYDEVIITRRVFRSGESEYLLNKTPVRLKDIMQLLAGTGIGVSSYSIAEQGRMDRVLSARPEDRREIFEEASGITRFKAKKREALLKLEQTENNLIRLADIINEVKRQINSIERQANKAERYRQEFEKLKELDVKLTLHEYNTIKDNENETKGQSDSLKQKEAHLSLELNVLQDELRLHREKIVALDEEFSDTRLRLSNITSNIERNNDTICVDGERVGELSNRCDVMTREIEDIHKRNQDIKTKIETVETEFNLINGEREKNQTHVVETEGCLKGIVETIKRCEITVSDSKISIMDNASGQSRLKNELSKIVTSLTTASSRHRRLVLEKDNTTKEAAGVTVRLKEVAARFEGQRASLDKTFDRLNGLRSAFEELGKTSQEKLSLIENLKQALASTGSKLEVLKDLKDKKEGFTEGVKAYVEYIENNPQAKESFVGVVADMLRPHEGFVAPLESALGEKSQLIVVKTKRAAYEALDYLKHEKKGRAQFLVLEELGQAKRDLTNLAKPSVTGRLADFVRADNNNQTVLKYILRDSYLIEDVQTGAGLARHNAIFVTKDGDMINDIIVSGGSTSNEEYTSIIGRDAKICQLSEKVEDIERQISTNESESLKVLQKLEGLREELTFTENTAKEQEIKLKEIESEKSNVTENSNKLQEELNIINLELDEIEEEEGVLKAREADLREEIAGLEGKHQRLEAIINECQSTKTAKASEKEKVLVALAEMRTEMSLVTEKYTSQKAALDMLVDSLREDENATAFRRSQINEAREKSHSLSIEKERLVEENRELASQRETVDKEFIRIEENRKAARSIVNDMDSKVSGKQNEIDELRSNISNFHINMTELSYKATSMRDKIMQSYKVDLDEEVAIFEGDEDWETLRDEVALLRDRVEKMGPVNLVAIDEFKELQERYEFLTSQQEDLLNAKESLHKAINKINRTTRKMFSETFEQIKVAFNTYFKLLFGGGVAELYLIDDSDILESGIEIVVRPPGKKLQNISLLSGGEKALTSIALLFSLFKVRPTPFCVLDEIDAPLDEANIDRFSKILHEFVKTTQFIIITHNKKTIAVSDVMYGITMEKSGISKIVSVKLAEGKKTENRPDIAFAQKSEGKPEASKVGVQDTEPVSDKK